MAEEKGQEKEEDSNAACFYWIFWFLLLSSIATTVGLCAVPIFIMSMTLEPCFPALHVSVADVHQFWPWSVVNEAPMRFENHEGELDVIQFLLVR